MSRRYRIVLSQRTTLRLSRFCRQAAPIALTLLFLPIAAHAQAGGSPFDTGFTALQTLFTGTVAKVAIRRFRQRDRRFGRAASAA